MTNTDCLNTIEGKVGELTCKQNEFRKQQTKLVKHQDEVQVEINQIRKQLESMEYLTRNTSSIMEAWAKKNDTMANSDDDDVGKDDDTSMDEEHEDTLMVETHN